MATKHTFMSNLLKGYDWMVIDGTAMRKLDSGATAKLTIADTGHHDHYTRLRLDILDVDRGKLDTRFFLFDENLGKDIHVIAYVDWDWYIKRPPASKIAKMLENVDEYLSFF